MVEADGAVAVAAAVERSASAINYGANPVAAHADVVGAVVADSAMAAAGAAVELAMAGAVVRDLIQATDLWASVVGVEAADVARVVVDMRPATTVLRHLMITPLASIPIPGVWLPRRQLRITDRLPLLERDCPRRQQMWVFRPHQCPRNLRLHRFPVKGISRIVVRPVV